MQAEIVIPLWQIIIYIVIFAGSYAVVAYMTRVNTKHIETLFEKSDAMMEEKIARETFVTLELYKSEVNHLNSTLQDVKNQNTQILSILTTKSNSK